MMKRLLLTMAVSAILLTAAGLAQSAVYQFTPADSDLADLAHANYYTWGVNWQCPKGESIVAASLTFKNIWDWQVETDDHLYVHLLNSATAGVRVGTDNEGGGDHFAGQGVLLTNWNDPQGGHARNFDLVVPIDTTNLSWLADGNFGFGLDPDCHYYNCGVVAKIETAVPAVVPEPSSLAWLASGLPIIWTLRKRSKLPRY
jgi:hypothetical protein